MAFGFRNREPEYSSDPAVTLPLYLKFLQHHIAHGGAVDYSASGFSSAQLEYQRGGTITMDETRRSVIAGKGTTIERPDLGYDFSGDEEAIPRRTQTQVYSLDGDKYLGTGRPMVYADVEFDAVLTNEQAMQREDDFWSSYVSQGYGDEIPARLGGTKPDSYALPQNAPTAGPPVPPTPEQLRQDEIVLAALSQSAEVKGEVTLPSGRKLDPDAFRAFQTAFGSSGAPVSPTAGSPDRPGTTPAAQPAKYQKSEPDHSLGQG